MEVYDHSDTQILSFESVEVKKEQVQTFEESLLHKKQRTLSWDNESFNTANLYMLDVDKTLATNAPDVRMEPVADDLENGAMDKAANRNPADEDDGFTVVRSNRKVSWEFILAAKTTDDEIEKTKSSKLLQAVAAVEEKLGLKFQPKDTSMGPWEQAR